MTISSPIPTRLVLESGFEVRGLAFGVSKPIAGEVVFTTSMTGYVETATDPSFRGQIVVLTFPLIGNYGVPEKRAEGSIAPPFESSRIQAQGLVIQDRCLAPSHFTAQRSLDGWLRDDNVAGLAGVDTRVLTQHLRERGTMMGWLFPESMTLDEAQARATRVDMKDEVFRLVTPSHVSTHGTTGPRVLLVDCGAKDGIVRALLRRGVTVVRAPWNAAILDLAKSADGIVIGNGPGDPATLIEFASMVRELLKHFRKPIFGICLGHQILSIAAGFKTKRLPYGHRGANQPVLDLSTRRSFITSQNHGFEVDTSNGPSDWEPWFVNLNDGSNEGIRCTSAPFRSVQFHPESCPGPTDTEFLFDDFVNSLK